MLANLIDRLSVIEMAAADDDLQGGETKKIIEDEQVKEIVIRLRDLLEDLDNELSLARSRQRISAYNHRQNLDVVKFLREKQPVCQRSAKEKGLQFAISWVDEKLLVRVDPAALEKAFDLLLSNALKFTEVGGIIVKAKKSADQISLEVADTGCGIDDTIIDTLFEEGVKSGVNAGHGRGLTIARQIAQSCGGAVQAANRHPEPGALFTLFLPISQTETDPEDPKKNDHPRRQTGLIRIDDPSLSNTTRVLVVEDKSQNRLDLLARFSGFFRTVCVAGYDQALAALGYKSEPEKYIDPDLIVCDIHLEGSRDGYRLFDKLAQTSLAGRPWIFISYARLKKSEYLKPGRVVFEPKPLLSNQNFTRLAANLVEKDQNRRYRQDRLTATKAPLTPESRDMVGDIARLLDQGNLIIAAASGLQKSRLAAAARKRSDYAGRPLSYLRVDEIEESPATVKDFIKSLNGGLLYVYGIERLSKKSQKLLANLLRETQPEPRLLAVSRPDLTQKQMIAELKNQMTVFTVPTVDQWSEKDKKAAANQIIDRKLNQMGIMENITLTADFYDALFADKPKQGWRTIKNRLARALQKMEKKGALILDQDCLTEDET